MLFAFNNGNGTEIADVQFNELASGQVHVDHVQSLVALTGVSMASLLTEAAAHQSNIHFIF